MVNKTVETALMAIDKVKGEDTIVFEFSEKNPFIDYVIITSASNMRQVNAIAEHIKESLNEANLEIRHIEGNKDSKWILVDADTVIIHVFEENERQVYALEKLYASCKVVDINGNVSEIS